MENESTASTPAPEKKNKSLMMIIGVVLAVVVGLMLFRNFTGDNSSGETAQIAGTFDVNGAVPTGVEKDKVKVVVKSRVSGGSAEYEDTSSTVTVSDGGAWTWSDAMAGTTYEMRADMSYDGTFVKSSNPITVTAPATGVVLTFNITLDDIPASLVPRPEDTTVSVGGVVSINGFIPSGSIVNVYGRMADTDGEFQEALSKLPASNGMTWEYPDAQYGTTYEYQAEMYTSGGTFIGQSNYIVATAPAMNERVVINSTATDPSTVPATTSIKGNIRLNGPVTQGSTVLLLQRKSGDIEYQQVERFPAASSIDYTWSGALTGSTYDVTAALQVDGDNTATGNVVTVTAPATGVNITLDTNFNLPAPTDVATIACGTPDSTNHYNAQISFQIVPEAKQNYVEVGTSAGSNNVFRGTVDVGQSAVVFVPADSPHFVRYAYSACTDCDTSDSSNWSGWSPTVGFKCPQ